MTLQQIVSHVITLLSILALSAAAVGAPPSKGDSGVSTNPAYMASEHYAKNLKGIEYFFIETTRAKAEMTLEKSRLLMLYNKQAVPTVINDYFARTETHVFPYAISLLDQKGGYLKLTCIGCENTQYMTYWNVSDKSKLVVEIDHSCGPVCDDQIKVYNFKDRVLTKLRRDQVIPRIKAADFLLESKNAPLLEQDAWEIAYHLPRKGKDILVTLFLTDKTLFKGNCLPLLWKDGKFEKGEVSFCTPPSAS